MRLTVLFDNSPVENGKEAGFSNAFTECDINFTTESHINPETGEIYYQTANEKGIRWDNLRGETLVTPVPEENTGEESNPTYLNGNDVFDFIYKVRYPASGSSYLEIEDQEQNSKSPDYLERMSPVENWVPKEKRAWQSYAMYIPENLFDSQYTQNKYTKMHLAPSGTGVKVEGYYITLNEKHISDKYGFAQNKIGNARGTFYDIVARMKTPTEFSLGVSIKVNAWAFHSVIASW